MTDGRGRVASFHKPMGGDGAVSLPGAVAKWAARVRFRDWAHFLVLPLASAGSVLSGARGVAIAALVLSFGYLVNGVADRKLDRDLLKNPLVAESSRHAAAVGALLAIAALSLSLAGPLQVLVATSVCLASGTVYSVGPRLKRIPGLGTALNVTNFLPLLWVGASAAGSLANTWLLGAAFAGLLLQNQLLHEAADAADDRRGGVTTTVLAIGPRPSAALLVGLGAVVATCFLLACRGFGVLAALVAGLLYVVLFPALLWAAGDRRRAMHWLRLAHRWCSVIAGAILFLVVRL